MPEASEAEMPGPAKASKAGKTAKAKAGAKAKAKAKAGAKAKAKARAKAKAKARPKAKARAKAKAKAGAKKPKSKASKPASHDPNDEVGNSKDANATGSKRRPRASAGGEMAEGSHPPQRHVWIGKRWLYEILPGQTLGCSSCRYIYFGCTACQRDCFRGKSAAQMLEDEDYQYALTWLSENGMDYAPYPVEEPEAEDWENDRKPKKRGTKNG